MRKTDGAKKDIYKHIPVFHFALLLKREVSPLRRVVFFGNFGVFNSGDEAILAGQLHELSQLKRVKVVVVSTNPSEIKRLHKVSSISFLNPIKIMNALLKVDVVLVGGGGLLARNDIGVASMLYQYYFWTMSMFVPFIFKKTVYVIGIGAYSNAHRLIVSYAVALMKKANIVTVRDHHSKMFLDAKQVKAFLYKDNSFLMPVSKRIPRNVFFDTNGRKKLRIGIALKSPATSDEEQKLTSALVRFILKYQKTASFWYFSLESNPRYASDKAIGEKLQEIIRKKTQSAFSFTFVPATWHPSVVFAVFSKMDFIVSMRFHSTVFSYRQRVPFLGISYDTKCKSFLDAIGVRSYVPSSVTYKVIQHMFTGRKKV